MVIRLDGLSYLEAIVEAGKKHQGGGGTAAALEAQKTLAVIQIQKQRMGMSAAAATAAASSSGSGGRAAGGVAALPDRKKVSVHAQSRQVDAAAQGNVFDTTILVEMEFPNDHDKQAAGYRFCDVLQSERLPWRGNARPCEKEPLRKGKGKVCGFRRQAGHCGLSLDATTAEEETRKARSGHLRQL